MKFKKQSKYFIAITAIFAIFVCVCLFVIGAYAASSTTNNNLVWKDDEKQNEESIETELDRNEKENDSLNNFDNNPDMPLKDQHIGKSVRITKEELSDELKEIINSCDMETWYVIESAGYQYIYFGGLPYNYAYQPEIYTDRDSGTVNIFDVDTSIGKNGYVLLEIQQNVSLAINYNGVRISYTER